MVVVAERRPVMNHKTDEYWGTLLLEMAHDAREDGDFSNGGAAHSCGHEILR